jgi:hypothetical protein
MPNCVRSLRVVFAWQAARKLWRRVGRNMDLVNKLRVEKMRKMRRPADLAEADMVEVCW